MLFRLGLACLCITLAAPAAETEKLQFVAIMSRHGVRSPLTKPDELNSYSAEPWPEWGVPLGYQTPHGQKLMEIMGDYYHQYFRNLGLLPASGCAAARRFYFWSDVDQRDIDTGHALAERMFPGCDVPIPALPKTRTDPLFNPVKAGIGKSDPERAAHDMLERIGGPPGTLDAKYRAQLDSMQAVLGAGRKTILEPPSAVKANPGLLADLTGPLRIGSTLADNFELEYTNGMEGHDLGWGRLDKAKVKDLLKLQEAYTDLFLRTPYLARASGSNLMSHMLRAMQQSLGKETVTGAMGKPGDLGLVILGHDSNESNLSGMLDIAWPTEDYPPHGRPPGSALIFEMWKNMANGKYTVRAWFVTQTLDQMRNLVPLKLKNPPVRVPITIPGCGGTSCDWDKFRNVVEAAIDPEFVVNQTMK